MATIFPKVVTALKTFSGKPLGVVSKVLGVAGAAAVVYDAHVNGKEKAIVTDEQESADRFVNQYNNYRTLGKESATVCDLKKKWFDVQQGFPYYHPVSKGKGYLSGFVGTVLKDLPVVALSTISLACKGAVSKTAGVLLGLHGIKTLVYDVMGIGKDKV